jgi:hypothetical protein
MAPRRKGWTALKPSSKERYGREWGSPEKARRRYESGKPMNVAPTRRAGPPRELRGDLRGLDPKRTSGGIIRPEEDRIVVVTDQGDTFDVEPEHYIDLLDYLRHSWKRDDWEVVSP